MYASLLVVGSRCRTKCCDTVGVQCLAAAVHERVVGVGVRVGVGG